MSACTCEYHATYRHGHYHISNRVVGESAHDNTDDDDDTEDDDDDDHNDDDDDDGDDDE